MNSHGAGHANPSVVRPAVSTAANFFGFGFEAEGVLLSLPEIGIGGIQARDVVAALRGRPGERRSLVLEREALRFSVEARVSRLP